MKKLLRRILAAAAAVVVWTGPASADPYVAFLGEFPEIRALLLTPIFEAPDGEMVLEPDATDTPYSFPNAPDGSGLLSLDAPNPSNRIVLTPLVVFNSRGIGEGFIIITELDELDATVYQGRMRVKGRVRVQFDERYNVDDFEAYFEEEMTTATGAEGWNHRLALAGRGGPDTEKDTPVGDVVGTVLTPGNVIVLETIQTAYPKDRLRINFSSKNRVTYDAVIGPGNAYSQTPEMPQRLGNRNFQVVGKLDFVYEQNFRQRVLAGLDVRTLLLTEAGMAYTDEFFEAKGDGVTADGKFAAKTDGIARRIVPTVDGPVITDYMDGSGSIKVSSGRLKGNRWVLGRLAAKVQVPGDRGVVYRTQLQLLVFDSASSLASLYEDVDGDKPANFLDINDISGEMLNMLISNAHVRQRIQVKYGGPIDVPAL